MAESSSERIVAFIDIVGWKHAFDTLGHDALVQIASEIAEHKAQFSPEQKKRVKKWEIEMAAKHGMVPLGGYHEINFSFVSDSFIVSAPKANLRGLLRVSKWACMVLLADHGFLTRGGITVGQFTHDMKHDIAIGRPLNDAVSIEKTTRMPRVVLCTEVVDLAVGDDFDGLIYDDGDHKVLNISNGSDIWLEICRKRIHQSLTSDLDADKKLKWKYLEDHLPKMASATSLGHPHVIPN